MLKLSIQLIFIYCQRLHFIKQRMNSGEDYNIKVIATIADVDNIYFSLHIRCTNKYNFIIIINYLM